MILLVASNRDIAGLNIARQILQNYNFSETNHTYQERPVHQTIINRKQVCLVTLKEKAVNAQTLPDDFPELDLIVFVSRHSSASGRPTLSVHTPGNFSAAELGGLPRQVSVSPAIAMQTALKALARFRNEMNLKYAISYECTHHGPSLDVPTMFIELGSSTEQWNDLLAAEAVAHATMSTVESFGVSKHAAVLGIGGPHYNQRFTQMALESEIAFGHIIPKYAIHCLDNEILSECVEKTREKVERAILDWKGIKGADRPKLLKILNEIGLQYSRI